MRKLAIAAALVTSALASPALALDHASTQKCADGSVIAAPLACPASAQAAAGPWIVFFDWNKSDIPPDATAILDNAAAAYQKNGRALVTLGGHADRSGRRAYNLALSQRRVDAVKAYLAGKGVADAVITTHAFGEVRPLVKTADGVREAQNRRVEITISGPGSSR